MAFSMGAIGLANALVGYAGNTLFASERGRDAPGPGRQPMADSTGVSISDAARSKLAAEQPATAAPQSEALPVGVRHFLERLVDDPQYASQYAEGYANNVHTACMSIEDALKGRGALAAGSSQLQAAWSAIRGSGGSPAEDFAALLKRELDLPQSYWDAMDPAHSGQEVRGLTQAKLDYLEQYIAAKKAA